MTNILLEKALEYAGRGWHVFPCREKPGTPYLKNGETVVPQEKTPYTSKGLLDATRDEDQIKAWWKAYPNAMIGINAGLSGLFVVDIDNKNVNGLETYETWNINDGAGLTSMTPSGGMHIIFSGKGKSSTNAQTGIDTRGEGGYFIVPPSKILEGEYAGEYRTEKDWGKDPGVIPDGLLEKLFPQKTHYNTDVSNAVISTGGQKRHLSRTALEFLVGGASVGERNSKLFEVACDFAGCGYDIEEARDSLRPVSDRMNFPRGEFEEVLAKAYSKPRESAIPLSIQEKINAGKVSVNKITQEEQALMEDAILACMIIENSIIPVIDDILYFEDFSSLKNRFIYKKILKIYNSGMAVDFLTVTNEIAKDTEKITLDDISKLINRYLDDIRTENAVNYAKIVKEKASIRKLETIMDNKKKYLKADTLVDAIYMVEKDITDVALYGGVKSTNVLTSIQATAMVKEQTKKMLNGEIEQLTTGFDYYDKATGGFYNNELIVCAARSGEGKCLKEGTLVIMYDGTMKKVENIVVGDMLMGVDSKPRVVLGLSSGMDVLYTIKQNRAQDYTVNSNHILSLKESANNNKSTHGTVVNIPIGDYLNLGEKEKGNLKGYKISVEFPKKELPIEPYYLGIWLGDGTSKKPQITTQDGEIIDYIYEYSRRLGMKVSTYQNTSDCWQYAYSGGMQLLLKELGVYGNKHIPFDYLTSDREDRLQLLAGFLDTDGHSVHNGFEITQKNKELLRQFKWLADSLGFRTSEIRKKICTIKKIGFSGVYYRMTIYGDTYNIPTKIERKQIKKANKVVNQSMTGITIVEEGIGKYYGFLLDGDGLFLLEDFTVTHNSALALSITNHVAFKLNKPVGFFSLEMSTHESICRLICQLTGLPFRDVYKGRLNKEGWDKYWKAMDIISSSKIFWDDTFGITIPEIRSKIRKLKEEDISLIIIDQLEQVKGFEGLQTHIQFDKICYAIKDMTQEFNIPIILNHQLNRNITDRRLKNPTPQLSDLNQAGEKAANQVWAIRHRYNDEGEVIQSKVCVLKNRNGPKVDFPVVFIGERMLFSNPVRNEDMIAFSDEKVMPEKRDGTPAYIDKL